MSLPFFGQYKVIYYSFVVSLYLILCYFVFIKMLHCASFEKCKIHSQILQGKVVCFTLLVI